MDLFFYCFFFSFKLPSSSSTPVSSDSESEQELKVGNTALSIEVWVSWNQLQFSTLEKWLLLRVFSCFKTTGRWQGQTSLQYDKCNFFLQFWHSLVKSLGTRSNASFVLPEEERKEEKKEAQKETSQRREWFLR